MIIKVQGASELQNQIYYDYDTDSIPLGQGGMGIVYPGRCFQVSNPNEYIPIAIKQLTDTSLDMLSRAMREASIQLDHPNLLRMYGFIPNMEFDKYSMEQKPKYYVAMEYLEGVSLANVMEGVFFTKSGANIEYARELFDKYQTNREEFVMEVMGAVIDGIQCLHSAGFIHRDIDPSNIMVTNDREIKIIDYGICKPLTAKQTASAKLTLPGAIIGKVDYGAPEIVTGDVANQNFTTDIYALGILLYQMVTGRLPFEGDNTRVTTAHLKEDVPVKNILNARIRRVVETATQKNQRDRYQTAQEMKDELQKARKAEKPEKHTPPVYQSDRDNTEPVKVTAQNLNNSEVNNDETYEGRAIKPLVIGGVVVVGLLAGVLVSYLF